MEAWREVARRIAHEIKNPLTPIQLSAQRLRRRYAAQLRDGGAVFDECTRTIVQQVEELKALVDEFSNFARMPSAPHVPQNLFVGGFTAEHSGQVSSRRAPHSPQNLWSSGFSDWQRGHRIVNLHRALRGARLRSWRHRMARARAAQPPLTSWGVP